MISEVFCSESVVYIVAKILGGREKNGLWQHGRMLSVNPYQIWQLHLFNVSVGLVRLAICLIICLLLGYYHFQHAFFGFFSVTYHVTQVQSLARVTPTGSSVIVMFLFTQMLQAKRTRQECIRTGGLSKNV